MSKLFETVIHSRLKKYLLANNILSNSQYAFRSFYSAKDAVPDVVLYEEDCLNKNTNLCLLLLDCSKAFDTVVHDHLIQVLTSMGIRGICNDLFRSYLHNRTFATYVNNTFSKI